MPLRFLVKTAITAVTPPVVFHSFPLPVTPVYRSRTTTGSPQGRQSTFSRLLGGFIPRHTEGAVPLRFLMKTAITVVTPPVIFNSFPLPVTHLTAVEPPRVAVGSPVYIFPIAWRLYCGGTAVMEVLLRGHGGDGGATAVIVRSHGGHGGAAAIPLRIGPTPGGTAEVLNIFNVSAVPPRRSAVLTVFGGATAINDGTTAEPRQPRRSWRCHCGLCRTSTSVAPRFRCDGGSTAEARRSMLNVSAVPREGSRFEGSRF